jgi:hypothetical protein
VLNDLLYPHLGAPMPSAIEIGALTALLGSHAGRAYVIKCRSWHSLYAAEIVQSLRGVPWTFLYRDPVEVAVSVLRKPPTWLRSRGLDQNPFHRFLDAPDSICDEEYVARMLGAFFASIPTCNGYNGGAISYDSLPAAAIALAANFGLPVNGETRKAMLDRAKYYSKGRSAVDELFLCDDEEKQRSASPALIAAIDAFTQPQLGRLLGAARVAA